MTFKKPFLRIICKRSCTTWR